MTRTFSFGMAAILALASGSPAEAGNATTVAIQNFHFVPETLKIAAGTRVTWTNKDDDPHTVMSATGLFRSGAIDSDQSFSYTFATPGTYRIACSLHPQMFETIVVE